MRLWETAQSRLRRIAARVGNAGLRVRSRRPGTRPPQTSEEALRRRLAWLIRELARTPAEFRVVANDRLDPDDPDHATRRLVFETVDPGSADDRYLAHVMPGDLLYLLWRNPADEVDALLDRLAAPGERRVELFTAGSAYMPPVRVSTNLRDALERYVDLAELSPAVLERAGLSAMAEHNRVEEAKHRAFHREYRRYTRRLARGAFEPEPDHPLLDPYRVELLSLLDGPRRHRPGLDVDELVARLGRSYGRQYTMSDWHELPDGRRQCEITVSQVTKEVSLPDGSRATRPGRSSSFLSSLSPGATVSGWVLPEIHYFPAVLDRCVPTIAVATGSGISGLLAYLRSDRAGGPVWGVYGVRRWETKHLYGPELEAFRDTGALSRLDVAASRPGPGEGPARRVQRLLWDERARVADWLRGGAHVFLCGRLSMGREVRETLLRILVDQGLEADETSARETMHAWDRSLRFQASVSGV